ncbi:MAG: hypothetical protein Q9160_007104 [Pyrenula sp. 1 TL-2023]
MNSPSREDKSIGYPRLSSQEARQEHDRSALPVHHSSHTDATAGLTSAELAALAQHRQREQQLNASYTGYGDGRAYLEAPRRRSSTENGFLRGVGAHLDPGSQVARANQTSQHADQHVANARFNDADAYADYGGYRVAPNYNHNPRQGRDERLFDPMDRYLRERPSDQPALFVDPVTGRLSYGGGYIQRQQRGDR